MLFVWECEDRLDRLTQLRLSPAVTADLMTNGGAGANMRFVSLNRAGEASRIDQLIEAGTWTDGALALIELALPAWKLRRLVYEDGEWFCSLSKQPNLPAEFDETADASRDELALAMQSAFVEARRRIAPRGYRLPRDPDRPGHGTHRYRQNQAVQDRAGQDARSSAARKRTGEGPGASLSLAAAGPCAIGRDPRMDAWQDVRQQRLAAFGV
jgi:hypothetical protein